MLTPEYLEFCTDDLLKLYEELDNSILETMARQIVKSSAVTDTVRWEAERLQESGMLYDDIISEVSKMTGKIESEVEAMFKAAGVETIQADNEIFSAAGLTTTGIKQSAAMTQVLKAGLQKTLGDLKNLTMTTAVTTQNAYINACNLAYQQVISGSLSHTEAVRQAVKKAATQSTTVLYPSGHIDQLDVAIRRACLTGVNQTCAQIQLTNAADLGCNLVEVTAHGGARPSHAEWQGKVYMINGRSAKYRNLYEATGYGTGPGLCGWNCRHNFFPYFEGSMRAYSKSELKDWSDPEQYQLTQQQRAYERAVRTTRRELSGYNAAMGATSNEADYAALKQDFDRASVKLKQQEARLKQFCEEHGLTYDSSRVQSYYGKGTTQGFGRSVSQKAVWANRKALQNQAGESIILIGNGSKSGISLSALVSDPTNLAKFTPETLFKGLADAGYDVKPLARGSLKGMAFEDGGGFKINFSDGGLLQYHPETKSHHGGAYYKISTGSSGTRRYRLDGTEIDK